jgi:hypothetical protein
VRTTNSEAGQVTGAVNPGHAAVESQLARLLESPQFRTSKRSQALLRFVVKAALADDGSSLKERSVGAGVFGRESAYDTAQDPIVRNVAIEVRKRLAQYYLEPEHVHELRIELPLGSYMPAFTAEMPAQEAPRIVAPARRANWAFVSAGVILLAAAAAFLWSARRTPAAELDAFWGPLLHDRNPIQICIGQPARLYRFAGPRIEELNTMLGHPGPDSRDIARLSISPGEMTWVAPEYLFLRDALSAFNIASYIQSKGRAYHLVSVSQTDYSRLRHEPMVAIGAFNNSWSMRVTAALRFVFETRTIAGTTFHYISDRQAPGAMEWKVAQPVTGPIADDFAIVTRVFDPATERAVVSVAGIENYGTLAASEFVTRPEYLGSVLRGAAGPHRQNMQFVLTTRIIDGTPGPPRIVAAHFW